MKRKKKRGFLACINGVKGAISLIMAVLIAPFLTTALVLVETGRYNSAISILDEALGVSSISAMANFDPYLRSRWGLLALSQEMDLETVYRQTLDTNASVMGKSMVLNDVSVDGTYSLGDSKILKNQILEYTKLNGPVTLFNSFANLSDFIGLFEKLFHVGDAANVISAGVGMLDAGITVAESATELKKSAEKLDGYSAQYEASYQDFETKTNDLIDTLKSIRTLEQQESAKNDEVTRLERELRELRSEQEATETTAPQDPSTPTETTAPPETTEPKEEDPRIKEKQEQIQTAKRELQDIRDRKSTLVSQVSGKRTSAAAAQSAYAQIIQSISGELTNFRTLMGTCQTAMSEIQSNLLEGAGTASEMLMDVKNKRKDLKQLEQDLERMESEGYDDSDGSYLAGLEYKIALEKELVELEGMLAVYDAQEAGLKKMTDGLSTALDQYSDDTIGQYIAGFDALRSKVLSLNIDTVNADTAKITRAEYRYLEVAGYVAADKIDEYLKEQENELKTGCLKSLLDGLIAVYNQIMGLSVFFEGNLNSSIDTGYYEEMIGGLPADAHVGGELMDIIRSIGSVVSSMVNLRQNIGTFNLIEGFRNLKRLCEDVVDLFTSLVNWCTTIANNIVSLLTGYDRMLMGSYLAYNLPCRTDYSDVTNSVALKTMTGETVKTMVPGSEKSGNLPGGSATPNIPLVSELAAVVTQIVDHMNQTGGDIAFSGAELEYILFGSNVEIVNQLYTFVVLYIFRILVCIPTISSNVEVQALAASSTFGYPVVMAVYYFLEPLVQTVLLVNGAAQPIVSFEVYLTPTGIPDLTEALLNIGKLSAAQKETMEKTVIDAAGASKDSYVYQKKLAGYDQDSKDHSTKTTKDPSWSEEIWSSYKKSLYTFEYKDYCLFLMLITVSEKDMLARLTNLIQMETMYYYKQNNATFTFDIAEADTFISVKAAVSVRQMLPSLIDSSLFTIEREYFRGY